MDALIAILPDWAKNLVKGWILPLGSATGAWILVYRTVRWQVFRWWPGREWSADCKAADQDSKYKGDEHLIADRAWKNGGHRWSMMREQRIGDWYELNLKKTRIISRIEAISDIDNSPLKYKLLIQPTERSEWVEVGDRNGPIDYEFQKPSPVFMLRFEIIKPRTEPIGAVGSPAWSINDIRLTEVRLFKRWWKSIIN